MFQTTNRIMISDGESMFGGKASVLEIYLRTSQPAPISIYPLVNKHSYGTLPIIVDSPVKKCDFL